MYGCPLIKHIVYPYINGLYSKGFCYCRSELTVIPWTPYSALFTIYRIPIDLVVMDVWQLISTVLYMVCMAGMTIIFGVSMPFVKCLI